jgi:flagellar biosynthesis GTPase FlhF
MDPDIISKISNLTADTFFSGLIFLIFYGFLAMIGLVIIGFIIFLILSDPTVSTCFWIIVHIFLLSFFSPYFLVILIIGIINYSFLAAKNAGNLIAEKANAAKKAIVKAALDKLEKAKKMKDSAQNSIKERAKKLRESAENSAKQLKESAQNRINDSANKLNKLKESAENSAKQLKESAHNRINDSVNKLNKLKESAENRVESMNEGLKNKIKKKMFGGEGDKSELEKFLEILEKTDYFQLWYYLLYVYTIQNEILKITKDLMQKMQEGVSIMKELTKMVAKKYSESNK